MKKSVKALFIVGLIVQIVNCTIFPLLWKGAWYHLNSLTFVLFVLGIYISFKKTNSTLVDILLFAVLHNLADEIFFDPTEIQTNEYVTASVILTLLLSHGKCKKIF